MKSLIFLTYLWVNWVFAAKPFEAHIDPNYIPKFDIEPGINGTTIFNPAFKLNTTRISGPTTGCWAGPMVSGPSCASTQGLISSSPYTYVCYDADPLGDTTLDCYGLGLACNSANGNCCFWKMHSLGYGGGCVLWGAVAATPSIACAGKPFGSAFNWSWSYGQGGMMCPQTCKTESCVNCGNPC